MSELNPKPTKSTGAVKPPAGGKSRAVVDELDVLIRARYAVVSVQTSEEERVEQRLLQIARQRNKQLYAWSCTQGLVRCGAEPTGGGKTGSTKTTDPIAAFDAVLGVLEPAIYLFKDLNRFLQLPPDGPPCNIAIVRRLREVSQQLRNSFKTVVMVAPQVRLPPELQKDVTVLEFELPRGPEIGRLLDAIIDDVKSNPKVKIDLDDDGRERLIRAAQGLTLREVENVFAKTLVLDGRLDGSDVGVVFSEKQQIIKKDGLLEYYEPDADLTQVAGLDVLKEWLTKRKDAFSDRAAAFGLPPPKGVLLLGVQGCGKSLCAKAVAQYWRLPLVRFDVGRLFGSLLGSSEENVRRAIKTAESVAPCVLWTDEIDKAFGGASAGGGSDGGTASRVFGTFLSWLSEKSSAVFVVATANSLQN
ncbi:MAG: AAA family ATPase, partial [Planctomycetia bacterium]